MCERVRVRVRVRECVRERERVRESVREDKDEEVETLHSPGVVHQIPRVPRGLVSVRDRDMGQFCNI